MKSGGLLTQNQHRPALHQQDSRTHPHQHPPTPTHMHIHTHTSISLAPPIFSTATPPDSLAKRSCSFSLQMRMTKRACRKAHDGQMMACLGAMSRKSSVA